MVVGAMGGEYACGSMNLHYSQKKPDLKYTFLIFLPVHPNGIKLSTAFFAIYPEIGRLEPAEAVACRPVSVALSRFRLLGSVVVRTSAAVGLDA